MTAISAERQPFGVGLTGGPTAVIDIAGSRIVVDPTFDPPGDYGYLQKTTGPAIPAERLGAVDLVLVSHAQHPDNLDESGRRFALASPAILTTPSSAAELGPRARPLVAWEQCEPVAGLRVTATPALHGPADERTPEGYVNCEVTGFLLEADGVTVYIGGDNASLAAVAEVARRSPEIDVAVLNAGGAHVPAKFDDRPLTFTAARVAAAAEVLGAPLVVVAHEEGWRHFADGPADTVRAFRDAGVEGLLQPAPRGSWSITRVSPRAGRTGLSGRSTAPPSARG